MRPAASFQQLRLKGKELIVKKARQTFAVEKTIICRALCCASREILLYHVATHVRLKRLGNAYSIGSLEVFKKSCHDARKSKC